MKNYFTLFPIPCEKILMFSNCAVWYIKKKLDRRYINTDENLF